jgi:hypothetical protein
MKYANEIENGGIYRNGQQSGKQGGPKQYLQYNPPKEEI